MVIEFLCPNGHKIRCGQERAGKAAKCPKCGEKFLVPDLTEIRASAGVEAPPSEVPGQIQFLCPNGHQLSATLEAQGTPGQCPHCGEKFHVPQMGEESDDRAQPIATPPDVVISPPIAPPDFGREEESYEAVLVDDPIPEPSVDLPEASPGLMTTIWREKNAGGIVEIQLADGEILVPDHYAPGLSEGQHALFATTQDDGSYTLTALAWDTIKRICVTGVKRLPEGF